MQLFHRILINSFTNYFIIFKENMLLINKLHQTRKKKAGKIIRNSGIFCVNFFTKSFADAPTLLQKKFKYGTSNFIQQKMKYISEIIFF